MSKEEYKAKQQQKIEAKARERQKRKIKKVVKTAAAVFVAAGAIFSAGLYLALRVEPAQESQLVSKYPIHWHLKLKIKILGKYQEIPANIGIGAVHQMIHTHDADGVIHIEPAGSVYENDIRLGRFFEIWGKTFNKNCIFEYCSGSQGQLKMFVNGEPNFEFENYVMQEGDIIEIVFE